MHNCKALSNKYLSKVSAKTILKNQPYLSIKKPNRGYVTMSPEDYLMNKRASNASSKIHRDSLFPLNHANHGEGAGDEIELYGVPRGIDTNHPKDQDVFIRGLRRNGPDLIFVQANPCNFMARQRFLSHKCALNDVEDYDKKGIDNLNPESPYSWEETIVNQNVQDMLETNELNTEVDYTKGFSTFSYPYHYDKELGGPKALTKNFVDSINRNIIGREFSEYNIINQAIYQALQGNHKQMLGDMPEILLRQIIGNSLSLEELKDVFKFVMQKIHRLENKISYREGCYDFLPHVFQAPKDLYMSALLKDAFQAATTVVAMVGLPHFVPLKEYWEGPPYGINFTEATHIPDRIIGETDEDQIEKQALLDSLLEKRAWGDRYITNPFPYQVKDITQVNDKDLSAMKKCFQFHYKKYESFKKMDENVQIPSYKERQAFIMGNYDARQLQEIQSMEMKKQLEGLSKGDSNDLMNLKINNWDVTKGKRVRSNNSGMGGNKQSIDGIQFIVNENIQIE